MNGATQFDTVEFNEAQEEMHQIIPFRCSSGGWI
jgi:hypothetical protein